jgi:hypothetical protein
MPRYASLLGEIGHTIGLIRNPYSQITSQMETIAELQESCVHCLSMAWLNDTNSIKHGSGLVVHYEQLAESPADNFHKMFDHAGIEWHPNVERYLKQTTKANSAKGVPDRFGVHQDKSVPLKRWQSMPEQGLKIIHNVIKDTEWNEVYPWPIK